VRSCVVIPDRSSSPNVVRIIIAIEQACRAPAASGRRDTDLAMLRPVATRREAGIGYRQIYLQRPGTTSAADLGEKDLNVRPIRYGRAQFEHD
jgi:hypothetical protein